MMAVKRSRSGTRLLKVLEALAQLQPVGVSELARHLADDKSGVQRMLMTLFDAGWIRPAASTARQWELTGRVQRLAHQAQESSPWRSRVHSTLEKLRDETNETVALTVLEEGQVTVVDVVESRQLLRVSPRMGQLVPYRGGASEVVLLAFLPEAEQIKILGKKPDSELVARLAQARSSGYTVYEHQGAGGSINLASPIFDTAERPIAALVLSAPLARLAGDHRQELTQMLVAAAGALSGFG